MVVITVITTICHVCIYSGCIKCIVEVLNIVYNCLTIVG